LHFESLGLWTLLEPFKIYKITLVSFKSNDKLELTERLQYEQHVCKIQEEKLAQQEMEVNSLR
jgi:hypothetical protein